MLILILQGLCIINRALYPLILYEPKFILTGDQEKYEVFLAINQLLYSVADSITAFGILILFYYVGYHQKNKSISTLKDTKSNSNTDDQTEIYKNEPRKYSNEFRGDNSLGLLMQSYNKPLSEKGSSQYLNSDRAQKSASINSDSGVANIYLNSLPNVSAF